MAILNKLLANHAASKARNAKCQCGSGLKFKHCHGDPEKMKIANAVANLAMSVMIHHRRLKAGLISEDVCDEKVGKLMEAMYNVLDPDFVVETSDAAEPTEGETANEVVESEDRLREKQEEEEPEPEVTGQEKIESIRESAGVTRCPKCHGVMMLGEEMCYKCKKGH